MHPQQARAHGTQEQKQPLLKMSSQQGVPASEEINDMAGGSACIT